MQPDITDAIPFTQFLLPDGRARRVYIQRPAQVVAKAKDIMNAGYRFECEMLKDGTVSLTIFDPNEAVDVAIELCNNGPTVPDAVDKLVGGFVPHNAEPE